MKWRASLAHTVERHAYLDCWGFFCARASGASSSNVGESSRGNGPFMAITVLHLGWCYLFCGVLRWGVVGAGAATSATFLLYGLAFARVYHLWGEELLLRLGRPAVDDRRLDAELLEAQESQFTSTKTRV